MKHKFSKVFFVVVMLLVFSLLAVACNENQGDGTDPVKYAVTYVGGAGSTGTAPSGGEFAEGAKITLPGAGELQKANHTFGGWAYGGTTYAVGAEFTMPASAVEFTAVWTENQGGGEEQPTTYTITYNINGATGTAPTESAKAEGAKFNVAAATGLEKKDCAFGGWSYGGKTYAAGDEFTMPASAVEFTAVWDTISFKVIFNPNNGKKSWTETVKIGEKVAKPNDPVGENGEVLRYWSTADGEYDFDSPVTSDLEIEAVYGWIVSYEIGAGATGSIDAKVVRKNERITLPSNTGISNGNKIFAGWQVKGDDSVTYKANEFYTVSSNVTFVAVWNDATTSTDKFTVSFKTQFRGEGTAPDNITNVAEGDIIKLPENTFTVKADYPGYVFAGWYVDNQSVTYQPGETYVMPNKNITFTAKWQLGKFNITYKAGEHSTGSDYVVANVSGGKTDLLDDLSGKFTVEDGYVFVGWKVEGSLDNTTYLYDYPLSQDTVFVAHCSIIFNAFDNSRTAQVSIDILGGYGLFATLDKDGYPIDVEDIAFELNGEEATITVAGNTFKGTYADNNLEITLTYKGKNYIFGFSSAQKYNVTVVKNNSNSTIAEEISGDIPTIEDKAEGEQFTIPADTFTRPHYTLSKWRVLIYNTTSDPNYPYWEALATYDVDEPIVMPGRIIRIEPVWTANKVTVSFNANGGSGVMADKQFDATTNFTYVGTKFQCTFTAPANMTFDYWSTTVNGAKLTDGTKLSAIASANDTVTLYAVWKSDAPEVFVNPAIEMAGEWTTAGHKLSIVAVDDITADDAAVGKPIGYAVLDDYLPCILFMDGGISYIASNYDYDASYLIAVNGDNLVFTNLEDDSVAFTFADKSVISNSPIADFKGKWAKPLANGSQKWIISDTKAYYNNSLTEANQSIIGKYIVIEFETAGYGYAYVMTKGNDNLVGYYLAPEKAPAEVVFEQGDYIVLTVDGVPNQIVASGAKPDASKIVTPTDPDGKDFIKWVIEGTETEFNADDVMTSDVSITAVFGEAAFAGNTYTGYCTTPIVLGMGGQTYVKFEIDFDKNIANYYLANDEKYSTTMTLSSSQHKPDIYGTDSLYFEVKLNNRAYYILVNADKTKMLICDSDDNALTNGEFVESDGSDSEYETVALADVTDMIFTFEDPTKAIYSTSLRSYVGAQITWNVNLGYRLRFVSNLASPASGIATINLQDEPNIDYSAKTFQQESRATSKVKFGYIKQGDDLCMVIESIVINDIEQLTDGAITLFKYSA